MTADNAWKDMNADYPKPAFIEPDHRFFVDTGQTAEETVDLVFGVLEKFDNDSQSIWDFVTRVYKSHDVAFAFFYGSALNINLEISEIEDIDFFVATRNKKFVYDWDRLKGTEIRYHLVSELESYLLTCVHEGIQCHGRDLCKRASNNQIFKGTGKHST